MQDAVQEMKVWLKETGSPASDIRNTQFGQELVLPKPAFQDFDIRR